MFSRLKALFGIFFYLSTVTLGGGLAMLSGMRDEFVAKRKWLTDEEMVDTVAAMQSMPGIIACNMGALLGYRVAGFPGALVSILGATLPPFLAIMLLASAVAWLRQFTVVSHIFLGVRAAIAATILWAAVGLGRKILDTPEKRARIFSWSVAVGSFVALSFFGVNAILVLVIAAILGWLLFWRNGVAKEEKP